LAKDTVKDPMTLIIINVIGTIHGVGAARPMHEKRRI
jgi:hypothetical protein